MARRSGDYFEFDWDKGNKDKNWVRHRVSNQQAEQIFVDKFAFVTPDVKHSTIEPRYQILGQTFAGRYLAVYYTLRGIKIRIISARPMNKKERTQHEKQKEI
ncbi:hypothetical protein A3D84_02540 [Candidatus Woesebacteria bacterium RIFCSPHIGHO2_02_FULL_42_20]|uniref:BrnT family toxin n=1 Tax=Candidatus Woesebacteria bacterium RIFCSPHIGHO2_12_FULL_41_24 TaxID=1802510 RepID=A0A1F8APW3_9BACT|nr:MAG: hypothetical protein A2W15_02735 [Candidatus Woesebacteria bacterium RBG_16_41_13]OGM29223.1 MAG: hypothetical protein A2873_03085 [Candidatus Woesebacteria bacterium RIFCSPHIGHO2_01_FULL_42_80]OGM34721.1 MAG: hypothetical protein A3D84_02540 [Candidatus Woesebacteria bacterium RIFCSPHIGHO2_02_FULL_42_20]OGM53690.1 MAG: hypothetical protein A3E44_02300 [Candidatus Woesebacteria bacterium RIFCSPHIGHO2_12_FULL_41_24]OGM67020.1 MAG: hypothetical protein A2969_05735 [Candidatus Woesebacteri